MTAIRCGNGRWPIADGRSSRAGLSIRLWSSVIGHRPSVILPLLLLLISLTGCGGGTVNTTYGRSHSRSVNGTGAYAGLFRAAGHEVRTAFRLTDELSEWADVIVRFSPLPGPPPKDEAEWYDGWLDSASNRRLIYIPHDYDATREYWSRALAGLPDGAPARLRERIEEARNAASDWANQIPPRAKEPASPDRWFAVETGQPSNVCATLSGSWASGIEPARAALTRHEPLKVKDGVVLLEGDGKPLVVSRERDEDGSRVLVVAGGTFLLNLPMVEPARWPLAKRTVDWACLDDDGVGVAARPRRVAFVEGSFVMGGASAGPSVFDLLYIAPMGRVAAQLFALGLVACLARAPRLGRPRPSVPSGADRPVAHPEALGALLARTGQSREARSILDAYHRWRHVGQVSRHEPSKVNDNTRLNP